MKITKKEFDSLSSDDISKRQYDNTISLIEKRVCEVWEGICKLQGRIWSWYDFDNESGEEGKSSGYFDPEAYKKEIEIVGEWSGKDCDMPYDDYIHIEFLWEDYEEKVTRELKGYKESKARKKLENVIKREELKERRKVVIASIKSKLTKEELSFTRFKDFSKMKH